MQRTAKAVIPECRVADGGWLHFDESAAAAAAEFQQRKSLEETNATWHMMQQFSSSSSSPSPLSSPTCNLLINSSSSGTTAMNNSAMRTSLHAALTPPPSSRTVFQDPKQLLIKNSHHQNNLPSIFLNPYRGNFQQHLMNPSSMNTINIHDTNCCGGPGGDSDQTLQLFPLRNNSDGNEDVAEKEESDQESEGGMNNDINTISCTPYKFFEFLPLKN